MWDETKRTANLTKHGLDLADFEDGFSFGRFSATVAKPGRDGRNRYLLIGTLNGGPVVATLGSEALSLISLRRASRKERNAHDQP